MVNLFIYFVNLCCNDDALVLIVLGGATQTCAGNQFEVLCVIGVQAKRCTDDWAALQLALLCLGPGPRVHGGEVPLVEGSWDSRVAAWHASNILKAAWGKAVEPGKHGHPRSLALNSLSEGATKHVWALTPAASTARGHSITSRGVVVVRDHCLHGHDRCTWKWAKISRILWHKMGRHDVKHIGHACPHKERDGNQVGTPQGPYFGNWTVPCISEYRFQALLIRIVDLDE